ncbi:hypothetical protein JYT16_01370 [Gemmatimonas aurantiaca]|nr:hypothetical protein [Gemmatimonas aurantiaca]
MFSTTNYLVPRFKTLAVPLLLNTLLLLSGCSSSPEPILYGTDGCAYCRMGIVDQRYGSELVTSQGKLYKFDSIECLAGFVGGGTISTDDVGSLWVTCFDRPGELTAVSDATIIRSAGILSPMGMNFSAFTSIETANTAVSEFSGAVHSWTSILATVKDEGFVQ